MIHVYSIQRLTASCDRHHHIDAWWKWWRHQMETFPALLAICAGNSPVPVNSPHKGQWRGALIYSLIWAWINGWVNEAGDLRRNRAHYDVIVMEMAKLCIICTETCAFQCQIEQRAVFDSGKPLAGKASIWTNHCLLFRFCKNLSPVLNALNVAYNPENVHGYNYTHKP